MKLLFPSYSNYRKVLTCGTTNSFVLRDYISVGNTCWAPSLYSNDLTSASVDFGLERFVYIGMLCNIPSYYIRWICA